MRSAQSALRKINAYTQTLLSLSETDKETFGQLTEIIVLSENCLFLGDFFEALQDDLNVPKALGCLFTFMHQNPSPSKVQTGALLDEWCAALYTLGIQYKEPDTELPTIEIPNDIRMLAEQRWAAKQARQFQEADRLRRVLAENGWNVLDRKDDYVLEPLKGEMSADI